MEQFSKLSLGGATIGAEWPKNWKSEKMGAKFVRTTSTIYEGAKKNFQVRTGGTKSAQWGERLCAPKVY